MKIAKQGNFLRGERALALSVRQGARGSGRTLPLIWDETLLHRCDCGRVLCGPIEPSVWKEGEE